MFGQMQASQKRLLAGLAFLVTLALFVAVRLYSLDMVLGYVVFLVVASAPVGLATVMLWAALG